MGSQENEIHVAFGVDENYAPHLCVVLTSIIANAPGARFRFHVVTDGMKPETTQIVECCAKGNPVDWRIVTDDEFLNLPGRDWVSHAAFFRMLLPELIPDHIKRIIYLDVDLVVTGDLSELWTVDLQGQPLGAVHDTGVDPVEYASRFDFDLEGYAYFNSGVLVIDLDAVRPDGFRSAVRSWVDQRSKFRFLDQDALNYAFHHRWTPLDLTWNMQRGTVMKGLDSDYFPDIAPDYEDRRPKIIHFTTANKPWKPGAYHRYIWKYYQYLKATPYWDRITAQAEAGTIKHLRRRLRTTLNWMEAKP